MATDNQKDTMTCLGCGHEFCKKMLVVGSERIEGLEWMGLAGERPVPERCPECDWVEPQNS